MNAPNQNPLTMTLQIIQALAHAPAMTISVPALEDRFDITGFWLRHLIKDARHLGALIRLIPRSSRQPARYQITAYPSHFAESVNEWLAYQEARQYCSRLNSVTGNEMAVSA